MGPVVLTVLLTIALTVQFFFKVRYFLRTYVCSHNAFVVISCFQGSDCVVALKSLISDTFNYDNANSNRNVSPSNLGLILFLLLPFFLKSLRSDRPLELRVTASERSAGDMADTNELTKVSYISSGFIAQSRSRTPDICSTLSLRKARQFARLLVDT